jgi:hypothetical protein
MYGVWCLVGLLENQSFDLHNFYRAYSLCFNQTSLTKDYGLVIHGLVAMGLNTSFTILLEHLPSQLEIAGLLQSSTPSCDDS